MRILEIRHVHPRPRIEGVDDHLAIDGARDLDAPVHEIGGDRRDGPVPLADLSRFREKIGALAVQDPLGPRRTRRQQLAAAVLERAGESRHERERLWGEHPAGGLIERGEQLDSRNAGRPGGPGL